MARTVDPTVAKAELENLLQGVAKQLIHRVYGPEGMPWGTKFADLEELAVQLGQAVSQSMIDQALARQAAAVPVEADSVWRRAATPLDPAGGTEPRAVATQVGTARWDEPKRYCPTMSGRFFPLSPGRWALIRATTARTCSRRSSSRGHNTPRSLRAAPRWRPWPG